MFQRSTVLALLGGSAAALGHAPFHLWFVAVPGFVALFWAVADAGTRRRAFWTAWCAGSAYFAITMHWIVEPFLVDAATHGWMAPGALVLMAGGLALFWGLAGWLSHWLAPSATWRAVVFALFLTAAELVRGHIFTGFPWAMPAYIWAETPLRISVAYLGSYGLTAVTLIAAAFVATQPGRLLGPVIGIALFAAVFGLGQFRLNDGSNETLLGKVGLVHPNVPQREKWSREKVPGHLQRLEDLTREMTSAAEPVDMVVWPEVAVVYPLQAAEGILASVSQVADGTPILLGINRREGEDWFNSMIRLDPNGRVGSIYDKVHLVPFGEYIPFRLGILRAMAATTSNGFSAGDGVRLMETPIGQALPLICYEGIFPGHAFRVAERADYILLLTNDAWFGAFAGPFQHFDQARFRAAEHGLPVVRSANSGVTGVIDRFGNVGPSLGLDDIGSQADDVWSGPPTLYARLGDLPLMLFLGVASIGLLLGKRRNTIANRPASS